MQYLVPGVAAERADLNLTQREASIEPLAIFLRQLHGIYPAGCDLGVSGFIGYKTQEASRAVLQIKDASLSLESLIRQALNSVG